MNPAMMASTTEAITRKQAMFSTMAIKRIVCSFVCDRSICTLDVVFSFLPTGITNVHPFNFVVNVLNVRVYLPIPVAGAIAVVSRASIQLDEQPKH
jgi:hypothetical protein